MNGILLIDKPGGWTSHDAVARLRGILREKRIGHAGTLDPMATGLLVVFIGRATRAVQFAEARDKEYLAAFRPGIVTDTQDITGTVLQSSGGSVTEGEFCAVLQEFKGEISQVPPMYSAIKVRGEKLYELARRGIEVEREPRRVTIKELELEGRSGADFLIRVKCSKGTYIRTLCHDIGERLGVGGALSSLRRLAAGEFSVSDALTIAEAEALAKSGEIGGRILPVDRLFASLPALSITEAQKRKCLCGNSFAVSAADGEYRVYAPDGEFLMLGEANGGEMRTVKSFFEVTIDS